MRSIFTMTILCLTIVTFLSSCSTSHVMNQTKLTPLTHDTYPAKNPRSVSMYTSTNKPNAAYRVIGIAQVSKHNLLGKKRQDDTLDTMIKNLAASMGGDGIIAISETEHEIRGNVIAYQKLLI
jgi:hypothetical protein